MEATCDNLDIHYIIISQLLRGRVSKRSSVFLTLNFFFGTKKKIETLNIAKERSLVSNQWDTIASRKWLDMTYTPHTYHTIYMNPVKNIAELRKLTYRSALGSQV